MRIYFTSDYHLGHSDIIRHCSRPFIKYRYNKLGNLYLGDINPLTGYWMSQEIKDTRGQEMNFAIVKNHNARVKDGDIVYHIGDFCFKGVSSAQYWESMLNGTVIHIKGNHDKNNGVKTYITHAIMEFGGLMLYVVHEPPEERQVDTLESHIISMCDYIICGHVHNLWKHKWIEVWNQSCLVKKLCINVGVDVWGLEPISISSILKYIKKVKRGMYD